MKITVLATARFHDHPELEALLEVRRLDTRISTFGDKLISYLVDGRLPVSLSLAGADTGRFTSSKRNMQNLPRGDVRRAVIVPEARILAVGDWSQMELRACAEPAPCAPPLRDGIDLHKLTASRMAGVAYEDVSKAQRQAAKAPNFGAISLSRLRAWRRLGLGQLRRVDESGRGPARL